MDRNQYIIKINSENTNTNFIFSVGIPFKKGELHSNCELTIFDENQNTYKYDLRPICYWSDKSIKWAILDILLPELLKTKYLFFDKRENNKKNNYGINIEEKKREIRINTGNSDFILSKAENSLFKNIPLDFIFRDKNGNILKFKDLTDTNLKLLYNGTLKTEVEVKGKLSISSKKCVNIRFIISFFYKTRTIKMDVELHNPHCCLHPKGTWDLGDPGSIFFKEFSIAYKLNSPIKEIKYTLNREKKLSTIKDIDKFLIYQDSSGGINWDSINHINYKRELSVKFKGFYLKAFKDNSLVKEIEGDRASPIIVMQNENYISIGVENFWQNFPKSIKIKKDNFKISLFPAESTGLFELQGGEKKTHTVFIDLDSEQDGSSMFNLIFPPNFEINPKWIANSKAISYFVPESEDKNYNYLSYVKNIIDGPNSFFEKREKIDEYGWRNFGDIYADHEAVNHKDKSPFISHYNNQYDFLYGAIIHFFRSSDNRWFELLKPLARHIVDIDIYHTDEDKSAYNHGMFWHTDHYVEAKTSTHRTYSKLNKSAGGGPSNEHNYTSGLLYYYFLTGDILAKEAVIELANWVIDMDMGEKSIYAIFTHHPTGLASQTVDPLYHVPGRGAGNSINALIDAYTLTSDRKYLFKAEELIRRTIHPLDDIEKLGLDDPEHRWSYLVYLQILDKYICLKSELEEFDWMYYYSIKSLIHYGRWMLKNEKPYKDVLHKVDIPTETWPAQDIRKAYVLNCMSKYVDLDEKDLFLKKARYFFNRCIEDVLSFKTACLTRPMVILSVYGHQQAYFDNNKNKYYSIRKKNYSFGTPQRFIPQKYIWKDVLKNNVKIFLKEVKRVIKSKFARI